MPPVEHDGAVYPLPFRPASGDDLSALAGLERDASLAALGHIFPPERFPFPFDDVLARWRLVLDDPATVVLAYDATTPGRLAAFVAYDDSTLRHVAVHPDRWGEGLGRTAVEDAVRGIAARGCREASLWALVANERARRLYLALRWRETDETREAAWPPYPRESRWALPLG